MAYTHTATHTVISHNVPNINKQSLTNLTLVANQTNGGAAPFASATCCNTLVGRYKLAGVPLWCRYWCDRAPWFLELVDERDTGKVKGLSIVSHKVVHRRAKVQRRKTKSAVRRFQWLSAGWLVGWLVGKQPFCLSRPVSLGVRPLVQYLLLRSFLRVRV